MSMVDPCGARGDAPSALIIIDATAWQPEFGHTGADLAPVNLAHQTLKTRQSMNEEYRPGGEQNDHDDLGGFSQVVSFIDN
jgi:hypothetical protein